MPTYSYKCPQCGKGLEIVHGMRAGYHAPVCENCKVIMRRDLQADMPNAGGRRYGSGFVSESLAISPLQTAEHNRNFPDVDVRGDGCLVFKDTQQHAKYLDKIGWDKRPSKKRKKKKVACKSH